jgi:hypothetical protein
MGLNLKGTDFITLSCYAKNMNDAAVCAYWLEAQGPLLLPDSAGLRMHVRDLESELIRMANLMGFTLTPKEVPAPVGDDLTDDTAALQAIADGGDYAVPA